MKKSLGISYAGWVAAALLWRLVREILPDGISEDVLRILVPFVLVTQLWIAGLSLRGMAQAQDLWQGKREWVRFAVLVVMGGLWCCIAFVLEYMDGFSRDFFHILLSAHLLAFAAILGTWLGRHVVRAGEMLPVCVVIALADTISVWRGPTRLMAEKLTSYYSSGMAGPVPWVDHLVVKIMVPGISMPVPVFGITDWVMVAMLVSAAERCGCDDGVILESRGFWYFPVASAGLMVANILAQETSMFLPALPVIALVFWIWMAFRHSEVRFPGKREWAMAVGAMGFFGLVVLLMG